MDGVPVFFDEGGKRWFMTGDIGEYDSEGISWASLSFLIIVENKFKYIHESSICELIM